MHRSRQPVCIESLEGRRLLSAVPLTDKELILDAEPGEITKLGPGAVTLNGSEHHIGPTTVSAGTLALSPGLPNLVRTYSGSYADPAIGLTATLRMTIRKEEDRGTYASMRGSFTAVTNAFGTVTGQITYGKVRTNLHVDMTISGTIQNVPYTATISGKASSSGSQIKGLFSFNSTLGTSSGTFVINKVVRS